MTDVFYIALKEFTSSVLFLLSVKVCDLLPHVFVCVALTSMANSWENIMSPLAFSFPSFTTDMMSVCLLHVSMLPSKPATKTENPKGEEKIRQGG